MRKWDEDGVPLPEEVEFGTFIAQVRKHIKGSHGLSAFRVQAEGPGFQRLECSRQAFVSRLKPPFPPRNLTSTPVRARKVHKRRHAAAHAGQHQLGGESTLFPMFALHPT